MRVAIFTPFLYPFHVDMATILGRITDVKLFTCGIYGNYPFQSLLKHATVLRCTDMAGNKLILPRDLLKFLSFRPSIVILFGIESLAGIMLYFILRMINAITIVIVEENNLTTTRGTMRSVLKMLKKALLRWVYSSSDILIAESTASKYYVLKMLWAKRRRGVLVKPHGIDVLRFISFSHMDKVQAKKFFVEMMKLPEYTVEKIWLGYIGEPSYYKGADVLIDALYILRSTLALHKRALVFFPGLPLLRDRIDLQEEYRRKLTELMKDEILVLYKPMPLSLMPLFYRALDIVILPSRLLKDASSDRSPNVALEALATGSLIIASRAGGIPDIVGNAGILIKPNDPQILTEALLRVLEKYDEYQYLRKIALQRALQELDVRLYLKFIFDGVSETVKISAIPKTRIQKSRITFNNKSAQKEAVP